MKAKIKVKPTANANQVKRNVEKRLYQFINPLYGGPEGNGWPFGRDLVTSEIYSCIQSVDGVEYVEEVQIFPADATTGRKGEATQRIEIPRIELICSYEHQIALG